MTRPEDGEQTVDCCFKLLNLGIVLKQQQLTDTPAFPLPSIPTSLLLLG